MATQLGIVVGIDSDGTNKAYRVLVATIVPKKEEKQYNWKFECRLLSKQQVIALLQRNVKWLNIKLDNGEIKGSAGDLKRFNSNNNHRPYVIISQLINSDNKIIGYKIANYDGGVKNIAIKEMVAFGNRAVKQGYIPIQNAIFIPADKNSKDAKSSYFKSYPNSPFIEERIITNKNEYADKRRVNSVKNEKTLNKLDDIYTPEQIRELKLGKKNGVDIRIYANPSLSARQMHILRDGLEKKVNVKPFAFPDYTEDAMKYYILEIITGMDIRQYLNPKYSIAQIAELSIAVDEGLDVSKMQDPSLSVRQMQERRIRLENNVFHEEDVKVDGSWI